MKFARHCPTAGRVLPFQIPPPNIRQCIDAFLASTVTTGVIFESFQAANIEWKIGVIPGIPNEIANRVVGFSGYIYPMIKTSHCRVSVIRAAKSLVRPDDRYMAHFGSDAAPATNAEKDQQQHQQQKQHHVGKEHLCRRPHAGSAFR
jgi:hypothetical protein